MSSADDSVLPMSRKIGETWGTHVSLDFGGDIQTINLGCPGSRGSCETRKCRAPTISYFPGLAAVARPGNLRAPTIPHFPCLAKSARHGAPTSFQISDWYVKTGITSLFS